MIYGQYTSVNDIPEFADYVAQHGPFDPNNRVTFIKNEKGFYMPDGGDHTSIDEEGIVHTSLGIYLDIARALDSDVSGMLIFVDGVFRLNFDGMQYVCHTSDTPEGGILYSCNYNVRDPEYNIHVNQMSVPGDHPLLMCFKPDPLVKGPLPVDPEEPDTETPAP
jgi:hypothetical protein